jgi:hypothetical protein
MSLLKVYQYHFSYTPSSFLLYDLFISVCWLLGKCWFSIKNTQSFFPPHICFKLNLLICSMLLGTLDQPADVKVAMAGFM